MTDTKSDIAAFQPCRRIKGSANDKGHTVRCACGIEITAPKIEMADAAFAAHRLAALNQSASDELLREAREALDEPNLPWGLGQFDALIARIDAHLSTGGDHG